jgi:AcrR family transcriptional regulator
MARPRSKHAHDAAIDATVDLLLKVGIDGVTIEEVACRSGVAKTTLYRHFGDLESLIVTAARSRLHVLPTPDTGDLESDLTELFERLSEDPDAKMVNAMLPMLIDSAERSPALASLLDDLLAERRRPVRTVLKLAQARGEIPADLDLDIANSLLVGPFLYWRVIERREVTRDLVLAVIRATVGGLRSLR